MKHSYIAALGALAVLSYTARDAAAEQPRYRLSAIGSAATSTVATAMSDNGKVTGGYNPGAGPEAHAFLYSHGTLTDLGILAGGISSDGTPTVENSGSTTGNTTPGVSVAEDVDNFDALYADSTRLIGILDFSVA